MNLFQKILLVFAATAVLVCGSGMLMQLITDAAWAVFALQAAVLILSGLAAAYWLSAPFADLIRNLTLQHQEHFETLIDLDGLDEIEKMSKLNDQMLHSLHRAKETLDNVTDQNAIHVVNEANLKEKESYYRKLFEHANDAVFIYDFEGQMLNVNKKACDLLGYRRNELLKIPFLDLQIEEEVAKSKAAFQTSRKTGSLRYESWLIAKDGTRIWVEISSSIVDLKKGIMQSVVTNITERKEIEKILRESEEKFRTFMETATDMMFICSETGILNYINGSMIRALEFSKKELIGMPFQELMAPESLELSKKRRQQLLDSGEDIHELILETKTRKRIVGEMKTVGIFDEHGLFQGFRGVFRDMTERKKIESAQRLSQLGRLSADIAHEVKNQLMLVSTRAQIALIHLEEAKDVKADIQTIIDQSQRINDVVKRLLQFSRPGKGDFQPMDINQSLNFVIDLVEKQFFQGHVEILRKLAPSLPQVMIDERQMQEVFVNLMQNAYEAMASGGLITIETSARDNIVQIDISDNGPGIDEKDLTHIFDPFFTTKENGTGLGLSACFGIIQAHQGDIHYSSKKGEGTTATILLPAEAAVAAQS
ncbi:PAS domain S-box protein [bacterium]|nr:PAS domain S-box protein [bacterium]